MKRRKKYLLLIGVLIPVLLVASQLLAEDRSYEYFVPDDLQDGAALMIFLHGRTGTGQEMVDLTRFNDLADQEGFVMLYPDGIGEDWNFSPSGVNDVEFLEYLIDEFVEKYKIDRDRVYLMGYSNGGEMAYYAACHSPGSFAGIATIDAPMVVSIGIDCAEDPVPVLMLMGTDDPILPWEGRAGIYSADETLAFWAEHNECLSEHPEIEDLPDLDTSDGSTVTITTYTACEQDALVTLYTVEGGGHTYPGHPPESASIRQRMGGTTMDIDANVVLWEWFESLK